MVFHWTHKAAFAIGALLLLAAPASIVTTLTTTEALANSTPTPAPADPCEGLTGKKLKKCRKDNPQSHDDAIYREALALATEKQDYQGALALLKTAANQQDPRILTYIGYSMRKMGQVDEAMGYYIQALAANPNSVETREYLGEAYLQKGDLTSAKAQLTEIANRCGETCETYTTLQKQITDFEQKI